MKKILVIVGGGRPRGNTAQLVDAFIRGAQEAGHQVEKVSLLQTEVKGCLGCNACYRNGGNCVQKDDMTEIREKMLAADVIVLASPIYFYTMTAQMEAGDIRKTDAPEQAYRVGKSL